MGQLKIHFDFNATQVSSHVGNFQVNFQSATIIKGPTKDSKPTKALDLGNSGKGSVNLSGFSPNTKKFCIQLSFMVNKHVSSRQNFMESNFLPFSLYADKATGSKNFNLVSSLNVLKYGWTHADTFFETPLKINKWYTASIVYDMDTLGLFVDDQLISVHGFPIGAIKTNSSNKNLYFGTWVDGARFHLNGALSDFKWYDGIPNALESLLDEQRESAQWHITYKHADIKSTINTGAREEKIKYNYFTGNYTQYYKHAAIMYHEHAGAAFEMHGSIFKKYKTLGSKANQLGYLTTDEVKATKSSGRKSLFKNGGIYWSSATGAHPVLREVFLEYENLGESKVLGFPTKSETAVPGGVEQIFQGCRMYFKNGTGKANEVHGAILSRYLALGGVRKWGFPVTNESDVRKGSRVLGKFSEFENCTIFWKGSTGAYEVHGDIRWKYLELGGPLSKLGFPTSNESDIPKHSGAGRINSFEKGCITWFGNRDSIRVALPFRIHLQRIHARESDPGVAFSESDIYFTTMIKNGSTVLYDKRHPSGGDYGQVNVINPNITYPVLITPNKIDMQISFYMNIWDADLGNDDRLGRHTTILNAANSWGYSQPNKVFNQSFSKIESMLWSIHPDVNIADLTEKEKWWKFKNFKTPTLSKPQYAAAFRDVDSDPEWWSIDDGLKFLYYEWVVKSIADGGNCFGMSLEAIYARKCMSLFGQPLKQVNENSASKNEINIKHEYQVGAKPIWWFLGQFVSGKTHDPIDVFNDTQNAFNRGDNPVLCISQKYDFSGAPHCIMPYKWHKSADQWKISVMDPNAPGDVKRVVYVYPSNNTFKYMGVGSKKYEGDAWTGGRMHYMPFGVLNTRVRTPVWDAIMLLLSGTILILADDAETVSIEDENGNDLDGNGNRAKKTMQAGGKPDRFFASYNGFETGSLTPGKMLLRKNTYSSNVAIDWDRINVLGSTLRTLVGNPQIKNFNTKSLPKKTALRAKLMNRSAHHILNDDAVISGLSSGVRKNIKDLVKVNSGHNFKHTVKGKNSGTLEYYMKSELSSIRLKAPIDKGEVNTVLAKELNTNACSIEFQAPKAKALSLEIINKLGVHGDYINMNIKNVPVQANKPIGLNIKSGFTGIEMENQGVATELPVKLSGVINGKPIDKSFKVPFDKAVRIKPSTVINTDEILVSRISKLFGIIQSTQIINID